MDKLKDTKFVLHSTDFNNNRINIKCTDPNMKKHLHTLKDSDIAFQCKVKNDEIEMYIKDIKYTDSSMSKDPCLNKNYKDMLNEQYNISKKDVPGEIDRFDLRGINMEDSLIFNSLRNLRNFKVPTLTKSPFSIEHLYHSKENRNLPQFGKQVSLTIPLTEEAATANAMRDIDESIFKACRSINNNKNIIKEHNGIKYKIKNTDINIRKAPKFDDECCICLNKIKKEGIFCYDVCGAVYHDMCCNKNNICYLCTIGKLEHFKIIDRKIPNLSNLLSLNKKEQLNIAIRYFESDNYYSKSRKATEKDIFGYEISKVSDKVY